MNTRQQMADFAKCVWLDYGYGDIIEMRALDRESGKVVRCWNTPSWYIENVGHLQNLNIKYDIYVGINPREQRGKGSAAGVMFARTLFAEFDNCSLAQASACIDAAGLPLPTCVVWSGGGPHCYWRLDTPCLDLGRWIKLQKRLILALGSDRTICDAPRIMRLPGFFNHKPGRTASRLVMADPSRKYLLETLELILPLLPESKRANRQPTIRETVNAVGYARQALCHECKRIQEASQGERHNKLFLAGFRMGQLVGGGLLEERSAAEELENATRGWQCECDAGHISKTIKDGMNAGKAKPRQLNLEARGR